MADYFPPPPTLSPGSKVWAYLRDSGGPAQGDSVAQQETAIRAYCERYDLKIVEVFKDAAKSGGSVAGRDDFERMIDMSEKAPPAGLLVWNFARFARDTNDSTFYKALLRKRGIVIHSLTDPIPADDFASRIVETMIDFANEEKRRQNSRDVKRGLHELVKEGFAPGTPPKGYTRVEVLRSYNRDGKPRMVSKWEPDPNLADAIILAFEMRARGRSYREIQHATDGKVYSSVNCWFGFFKNKTYIGDYKFGDTVYHDHHPPIVTHELFDAVQRMYKPHSLAKNNPMHARRVGVPSLLSGITFCDECGAMMIHNKGAKVHRWNHYICGTKDRQGAQSCPSKRIGERKAVAAILDAVRDQVLSVEYLKQVMQAARAKYGDASGMAHEVRKLQSRLDALDLSIARIYKTIERTGSERSYQRHEQLEAERAKVQAELDYLNSQMYAAQIEITPEAMQIAVETWKEQLNQARETNDIRLLKSWLMRFVSRIDLGYNRAKIFYTYPMVGFSLSALEMSRNELPAFWGHTLTCEKSIQISWR